VASTSTSTKFSPALGWRIAAYEPDKSLKLPQGITLSEIEGANGQGLTTADRMTLYWREEGEDDSCTKSYESCLGHWQPLLAPEMAMAVGNFSTVRRFDGTLQWAFRGKRLYLFDGDYTSGDAYGIGVDPHISVAVVVQDYLPSGVRITTALGRGYILTIGDGAALYERHPFEFRWGARGSHDGFRNAYWRGKLLGTQGCDAACLKVWHPFTAPRNAQGSGYWEVVSRPDGSKQWAYRGYVLYTYSGDKKPGDVNGSNLYDIVSGDKGRYSMQAAGGGHESGSGLFWHVANPY
jgi:predicted lipoprotein with Yx(FWY)xxD motif